MQKHTKVWQMIGVALSEAQQKFGDHAISIVVTGTYWIRLKEEVEAKILPRSNELGTSELELKSLIRQYIGLVAIARLII